MLPVKHYKHSQGHATRGVSTWRQDRGTGRARSRKPNWRGEAKGFLDQLKVVF